MDINNNTDRGNTLITYLFPDNNNVCTNITNELIMQREITALMHSFKERGFIKRFAVADDEVINDRIKNNMSLSQLKASGASTDEIEVKELP